MVHPQRLPRSLRNTWTKRLHPVSSKKAAAYGVQFTPEEIYDLSGCCNTEAMNVLLDSSKCRFTKEQLEDLYGAVDDEVLERVAARNKIRLFEDDEDEELEDETGEEEFFDEPVVSAPKIGFFTKLFAGIGIADALSSSRASHQSFKRSPFPSSTICI